MEDFIMSVNSDGNIPNLIRHGNVTFDSRFVKQYGYNPKNKGQENFIIFNNGTKITFPSQSKSAKASINTFGEPTQTAGDNVVFNNFKGATIFDGPKCDNITVRNSQNITIFDSGNDSDIMEFGQGGSRLSDSINAGNKNITYVSESGEYTINPY